MPKPDSHTPSRCSALRVPHSALKWWEALVMLQSSLPVCFATPVLQTGNRNAYRIKVRGRTDEV